MVDVAPARSTSLMKSRALKKNLQLCDAVTEEADAVLRGYTTHLTSLVSVVEHVAVQAKALVCARSNIHKSLRQAEEVLHHLDTARKLEQKLMAGPQSDLHSYLGKLKQLDVSIDYLEARRDLPIMQVGLENALDLRRDAMRLCLVDFHMTLQKNNLPTLAHITARHVLPSMRAHRRLASKSVTRRAEKSARLPGPSAPNQRGANGASSSGWDASIDVVSRLQTLAQIMLRNNELSCTEVYIETRRVIVARTQRVLSELEKAADEVAKYTWPQLQRCIEGWMEGMMAMRVTMTNELEIANAIFPTSQSRKVFDDLMAPVRTQMTRLLGCILSAPRVPQKVLGMIKMWQLVVVGALGNGTVSTRALQEVRIRMAADIVAETRATFAKFRASVPRDAGRQTVGNGTVHTFTAATIAFLKQVLAHDKAINVLFGDPQHAGEPDDASQQALVACLKGVFDDLWANLNVKAATCKDKALRALFLMNNLHFMVKVVEASPRLSLIGAEWIESQKDQVEVFGAEYQQLTWAPWVGILRAEAAPGGGKVAWSREAAHIKDTFRGVNAVLAHVEATQAAWSIPDALLRGNLREAICEDVLPPYEEFLQRTANLPFSPVPEKYLVYSAQDVRDLIMERLFTEKAEASVSAALAPPSALPSLRCMNPDAL